MKTILFISLDENFFTDNSTDVLKRQILISKNFKKMIFIVFTRKKYESKTIGNIEIIPTNSKNIISGFFDIINILKQIKKSGEKIDVVSTQDPFFLGLLGLYAKKLFKAKFKPQLHIEVFTNKYWKKESILNYMQYLIGFFVIKKADKVRVVSRRCENYLKSKNIEVSFIPVPTDFSKFSSNKISKIDTDLFTVARFVEQKNLFFLIEVVNELKQKYPNIILKIAGYGPLESKIKNKIKHLGLEKNIILLGTLPHSKVAKYMQKSKLFVLPSLYEGWGLVCIEASLSNVPVIMTRTGCADEIIIDNKSGKVCEINNKEEFIAAISELLENENLRKKYALAAKKLCKTKLDENSLRRKWVNFLNG